MSRAMLSEVLTRRVFGSYALSFNVDGTAYHCEPQKELIEPEGYDYRIQDITLLNEQGQKSGALFQIRSGATRVMRVADANYQAWRWPVRGWGWFLRMSPNEDVLCEKVSPATSKGDFFRIGLGWVDCMIAGKRGMTVAEIAKPAFDPSYEVEIPVGEGLTGEFWDEYYKIMARLESTQLPVEQK